MKPIENLKLSVRGGKGKITRQGSTAHISLDIPATVTQQNVSGSSSALTLQVTQTLSYEDNENRNYYLCVSADNPSGEEYQISKWIGSQDTEHDLRNFVPWFKVGDYIRVQLIGEEYFIVETLSYVGTELVASIWWSETDGRMRSVIS